MFVDRARQTFVHSFNFLFERGFADDLRSQLVEHLEESFLLTVHLVPIGSIVHDRIPFSSCTGVLRQGSRQGLSQSLRLVMVHSVRLAELVQLLDKFDEACF